MALLTTDEIADGLKSLDGWSASGTAITKSFTFQDFPEAVLFVSALVPGSGTFGMESVARQFATDKHVMVIQIGRAHV